MKAAINYILFVFIILLIACGDKDVHRKQQFLLKGNESFKNQNYNQAIHYFSEAIKADSCYADALNNLATLHYSQNNLDEALHLYERAVACDPDFYQAKVNLSNTLYDLKQYYRGLEILQKQIILTPDSGDVYFGIGLHLTRLREYDSAVHAFQKAHQLQPVNEEILVNLGTIYYYQRDFEKAITQLQKALDIDPDETEAYNTLALIAVERGNFKAALGYINKALEVKKAPHFLNNKGYILIQLDSIKAAGEAINESIVVDPWNGWAYRNKAILKLKQNQPEEALVLLKRAESLEDHIEDLNYYFGETYRQLNMKEKSCELYNKGLTLKENKAKAAFKEFCK